MTILPLCLVIINTYIASRVSTSPIEDGIFPDNWLLLNSLFKNVYMLLVLQMPHHYKIIHIKNDTYTCIRLILELKSLNGITPDNWLFAKWLHNGQKHNTNKKVTLKVDKVTNACVCIYRNRFKWRHWIKWRREDTTFMLLFCYESCIYCLMSLFNNEYMNNHTLIFTFKLTTNEYTNNHSLIFTLEFITKLNIYKIHSKIIT